MKYKEAIFEFEDANGMIQYFRGKDKEDATISFKNRFMIFPFYFISKNISTFLLIL